MNKLFFFTKLLTLLLLLTFLSCESDKFSSTLRSNRSVKVGSYTKISDTEGNFAGTIDNSDYFGRSACSLGDLNNDGTVKSYQKISDAEGDFLGTLDDDDFFGCSVCSIGDLDNDGITDIAVGACNDDDGVADSGAVWILFLNNNGSVKSYQKISNIAGDFTGGLVGAACFGDSVSSIGDLDKDGINDIAVGAHNFNAVWILFLNTDGTVKSYQKISDAEGNFWGTLDSNDYFGRSVCSLGDLNNDGITDIAVGAHGDDEGGDTHGAIWILFLNSDGTVKFYQKISDTEGSFTGTLDDYDSFGFSVCSAGDLNNDGVIDIAVGAYGDDGVGSARGAIWILFLKTDGTVKSYQKISDTEGSFLAPLDDYDYFGISVCSIGDLNNDGMTDIVVGVQNDDDGGTDKGAVYNLFLNRVY